MAQAAQTSAVRAAGLAPQDVAGRKPGRRFLCVVCHPARPSCRARQARCILPAPARSRLPPDPVRGGMFPGRLPAGLGACQAGLVWAPASRPSRPCRPADAPAFGVHRAQAELRRRFTQRAGRREPGAGLAVVLSVVLPVVLPDAPALGGQHVQIERIAASRLPSVPSLPKPLRRSLAGKNRLDGALEHQASQHGRVRLEQVLYALSSLQAERRLGRGRMPRRSAGRQQFRRSGREGRRRACRRWSGGVGLSACGCAADGGQVRHRGEDALRAGCAFVPCRQERARAEAGLSRLHARNSRCSCPYQKRMSKKPCRT